LIISCTRVAKVRLEWINFLLVKARHTILTNGKASHPTFKKNYPMLRLLTLPTLILGQF
jgi:hypothetical protein